MPGKCKYTPACELCRLLHLHMSVNECMLTCVCAYLNYLASQQLLGHQQKVQWGKKELLVDTPPVLDLYLEQQSKTPLWDVCCFVSARWHAWATARWSGPREVWHRPNSPHRCSSIPCCCATVCLKCSAVPSTLICTMWHGAWIERSSSWVCCAWKPTARVTAFEHRIGSPNKAGFETVCFGKSWFEKNMSYLPHRLAL